MTLRNGPLLENGAACCVSPSSSHCTVRLAKLRVLTLLHLHEVVEICVSPPCRTEPVNFALLYTCIALLGALTNFVVS